LVFPNHIISTLGWKHFVWLQSGALTFFNYGNHGEKLLRCKKSEHSTFRVFFAGEEKKKKNGFGKHEAAKKILWATFSFAFKLEWISIHLKANGAKICR
jgi:hypothetical protein